MPWPRRKLLTLLDVGLIAGGGGPIEPPYPPILDGVGVWYRADQGAYTSTSALFNGSNSLSIPINPTLATGSTDFTWGGWMMFNSNPIAGVMNTPVWRIYSDGTGIRATVTGSAYVEAYSPAMANGTWYFIVAGYVARSGGQVYVLANNTIGGAGVGGGVGPATPQTTGNLDMGAGFNGRFQGWFQWNRELTVAERTFLYNAGVGRRFDELDATIKTGLQGWWPMNELSGPRRDLSGNNNTLTDSGSVASAAGKYYEQAGSDNSPIAIWDDSGPNDFDLNQGVVGNQPVLQWDERNGKPVVRFDGVDDYMQTGLIPGSALSGATAQTVFIVQRQSLTDAASTTYNWDPDTSGANMLGAHLKYSDNVLYYDTGSAVGTGRLKAIAPEPWQGTWHVIEMVRDGSTTNSSFTIEGNPISAYTAQPTSPFNPAPSAVLRIAEHAIPAGTNIFQGDIAEFIMFNRTLTIPERTIVRNYLQNKWGISSNKLITSGTNYGYLHINSTTNDRLAVN